MSRIGLFGGTFDPPHYGHRDVAQVVLDSGLVDKVWFLPCWKHAFGKEPSSFDHRVRMCVLLVQDCQDIYVCNYEGEVCSTYSIEILEYILGMHPRHDFRLVIGSDNYSKISQWKDHDKVVELANPIWVARPGPGEQPEGTIECDSTTSSTDIRNLLEKGLDASELTSPEVLEFAKRHKLFPTT